MVFCIQFDIEGRKEVGWEVSKGREEVCKGKEEVRDGREEVCEGQEEVVRGGRRW